MSRYLHQFPKVRKQRYSALFSDPQVKAKAEYNKDMAFRTFVIEWNKDAPELFSWSLADFYSAYRKGGYQLKLSL